MAPPKRVVDKGKVPTTIKLPIQKARRPPPVNYRPFLNASCRANYTHYFSKRLIVIERSVHEESLFDTLVGYTLIPGRWKSLMTIKREVQEEAVWVFWSNIHDSSLEDLNFHTELYGVQMDIDPSIVAMLLGIARPTSQAVAFPPEELDKAVISEVFSHEGTM